MREVRQALVEAMIARRERWIEDFMSAPIETRKAWFERYQDLSNRKAQGSAAMSGEEVAQWIALQGEIGHLSLRLVPESYTVY